MESELNSHDELLDRVISKYDLDEAESSPQEYHSKAQSMVLDGNQSQGLNTDRTGSKQGIDVEDIDKMLEKYDKYNSSRKNSASYDNYENFKTFGDDQAETENSVDRINKKYFAHLADDSEIKKNRALIDDLRSNLRQQTIANMKKIA